MSPPRRQVIHKSLHLLHEPGGRPLVDIVLFHGLQILKYEKAYEKTWKSGSGFWPEWLAKDVPGTRIFSVSYDSRVLGGEVDLKQVGRILLQNVVIDGKVGEECPVILVGHSLGGLVIKQLCLEADRHLQSHRSSNKYVRKFIRHMWGIFYYSVPHGGSELAGIAKRIRGTVEEMREGIYHLVDVGRVAGSDTRWEQLRNIFGSFVRKGTSKLDELARKLPFGPMLNYLTVDSPERMKLNNEFKELRKRRGWKARTVAETEVTCLGFGCKVVVTLESAKLETGCEAADEFFSLGGENHHSICRPESRASLSYVHLMDFVQSCQESRFESSRRNFRHSLVAGTFSFLSRITPPFAN